MLPNFDQKVTFGETKIKRVKRVGEGGSGGARVEEGENIVGCKPH